MGSHFIQRLSARNIGLSLVVGAMGVALPAFAQEDTTADEGLKYLRVVEEPGERLSLEVAARRFVPSDGVGPEVVLVSVAHIGDPEMYRRIQEMLNSYDVVLYESVKPAGAASPGGETDSERIETTNASMRYVAGLVESYNERQNEYPESLETLASEIHELDPRLAQWLLPAQVDGWNNELKYTLSDDADMYQLISYGSDGEPGGEDAAADLSLSGNDGIEPLVLTSEDGIQGKMAEMLNLDFQLTTIDYGNEKWRCSDMSIDQVDRALRDRGIEFGPISGALSGGGFPPALIDMMVKLVRVVDAFVDGMMSDMTKVMMIDLLGNDSLTEQVLNKQFGAGFAEVIIGERNQIVMDDLTQLIEDEPEVKTVGIFYGAAHMQDFEDRLREQLNYEASSVEWIPALTVDLETSALTAGDIKMMRGMMKSTLKRMMR